MPDGDTRDLTNSRARLDAVRRTVLREIRIARQLGTPRWELAEDVAALRRAALQLLEVLA